MSDSNGQSSSQASIVAYLIIVLAIVNAVRLDLAMTPDVKLVLPVDGILSTIALVPLLLIPYADESYRKKSGLFAALYFGSTGLDSLAPLGREGHYWSTICVGAIQIAFLSFWYVYFKKEPPVVVVEQMAPEEPKP